MAPPRQRTVLQQALRGTAFVVAIAAGIMAAAAAMAVVFVTVMA